LVAADSPQPFPNDTDRQALMLAGMAAEAVLKAVILCDANNAGAVAGPEPKPDDPTRDLHGGFHRHDLEKLAALAQLKLTKKQTKVARALTQYIEWRGRYPVPKESRVDDDVPQMDADGLYKQKKEAATFDTARELLRLAFGEYNARRIANSGP
jgi:hypothetical protein